MKKNINVYFSANMVDKSIVNFLKQSYNINIINIPEELILNISQKTADIVKSIDLMVFTGGEDVSPLYYGETIGKYTNTNSQRDTLEFKLINGKIPSSIIKKIPKLGICRGAQLLTVYNGGKLIQHVVGHNNNEQIIELKKHSIEGSKTIQVSSDHHQMMFPYNLEKSKYELLGWSKNFQSNTYLNGENNEIELPKNFLEPEIIHYNITNSLCIQSHPEWCVGSIGSNECLRLIDYYLIEKKFLNDNNLNNTNLPPIYDEINDENF